MALPVAPVSLADRQALDEAILQFLADPPATAFQSGYLAALLWVHRECFQLPDTTETNAARDMLSRAGAVEKKDKELAAQFVRTYDSTTVW
jgi:hypothetical protein